MKIWSWKELFAQVNLWVKSKHDMCSITLLYHTYFCNKFLDWLNRSCKVDTIYFVFQIRDVADIRNHLMHRGLVAPLRDDEMEKHFRQYNSLVSALPNYSHVNLDILDVQAKLNKVFWIILVKKIKSCLEFWSASEVHHNHFD